MASHGRLVRPTYALGMRQLPLPTLWTGLEVRPELTQEHEWWLKKIDSDFNMAPSFFLRYLRKGKIPRSYYDAQNAAYGNFLLPFVAAELARIQSLYSTDFGDHKAVVEEFGMGAGHTVRWLALAHSLGCFEVRGWDWVTNALVNAAAALEPCFKDFNITDKEPEELLYAGEIEDVLDREIAENTQPMLRLFARTLHHANRSRMENMMYKTGKSAHPEGVATIIHPLPSRRLNRPIKLKYVSGNPWEVDDFLKPYSEGCGQKCIVLRANDFEFFKWQTLTAFTIGPAHLKSQYELLN